MKKIIFLITLMLVTFTQTIKADVYEFKTTAYARATVNNGCYTWTDWKSSNMKIVMNGNTDKIIVYSPRTQIYKIYGAYNDANPYTDNDGGQTVKFYVTDQDGDYGHVRLRIAPNGTYQIYVDFNDCAWVYNVIKVN